MNNSDINTIKEFRRFINTYIYPETAYMIAARIGEECMTSEIIYESTPQATIKFRSKIKYDNNLSNYTQLIHTILKIIFIEYFNNVQISSLIKNKIHTEIQDENLKNSLRSSLLEIQNGNPLYLGLLFNITILNDQNVYLYL